MTCEFCDDAIDLTLGLWSYCPKCDLFLRFCITVGTLELTEAFTLTEES